MSEEIDNKELSEATRIICEALRDSLTSSLEKSLQESYQDYLVHGILDIKIKEQ